MNWGMDLVTLMNEQICHLKYERVSKPDEELRGYDIARVKEAIDQARKCRNLPTGEAVEGPTNTK